MYSAVSVVYFLRTNTSWTLLQQTQSIGMNPKALFHNSYMLVMLLTFILIIIGIPSPPHSFIPGLKSFFSANLFHRSIPFLHQD